jgi:hypothetical protein
MRLEAPSAKIAAPVSTSIWLTSPSLAGISWRKLKMYMPQNIMKPNAAIPIHTRVSCRARGISLPSHAPVPSRQWTALPGFRPGGNNHADGQTGRAQPQAGNVTARPSVCPSLSQGDGSCVLWNYRTLEGNRERCVSYFTLRWLSKKCMGLPARPLPGRSPLPPRSRPRQRRAQ